MPSRQHAGHDQLDDLRFAAEGLVQSGTESVDGNAVLRVLRRQKHVEILSQEQHLDKKDRYG